MLLTLNVKCITSLIVVQKLQISLFLIGKIKQRLSNYKVYDMNTIN